MNPPECRRPESRVAGKRAQDPPGFVAIQRSGLPSGRRIVPRRLPIAPVLERDQEEGVVGGANEAEQAEADDRRAMLHARSLRQNLFDFLGGIALCAGATRHREAAGAVKT